MKRSSSRKHVEKLENAKLEAKVNQILARSGLRLLPMATRIKP